MLLLLESKNTMEVANASIAAITSPLQSVKAGKEVDKEQEHSIAAALLSLKQNNELQEGTKKIAQPQSFVSYFFSNAIGCLPLYPLFVMKKARRVIVTRIVP